MHPIDGMAPVVATAGLVLLLTLTLGDLLLGRWKRWRRG